MLACATKEGRGCSRVGTDPAKGGTVAAISNTCRVKHQTWRLGRVFLDFVSACVQAHYAHPGVAVIKHTQSNVSPLHTKGR